MEQGTIRRRSLRSRISRGIFSAKKRKNWPILQFVGGDGTTEKQPVLKGPKVGRNDPCPCGSGKKYKKCCGVAA